MADNLFYVLVGISIVHLHIHKNGATDSRGREGCISNESKVCDAVRYSRTMVKAFGGNSSIIPGIIGILSDLTIYQTLPVNPVS